jgi:hypothetical protein
MKGITLIPTEPLSEKAKEKLRKLSGNQKKRLEQMKKDFEDGKYNLEEHWDIREYYEQIDKEVHQNRGNLNK